MASGPIISWQIDGEKMETVTDFTFLDSKITVDSDCSHELKDARSLQGKLWQTNTILKSRDIHFADKGLHSQSYGFPSSHAQMWELDHKEGWAPRTDGFKLRRWRRLLRVLWTERRSNQSILQEINPEYSLEGLILKLKLQYFGHLMQRASSLKKTIILG